MHNIGYLFLLNIFKDVSVSLLLLNLFLGFHGMLIVCVMYASAPNSVHRFAYYEYQFAIRGIH